MQRPLYCGVKRCFDIFFSLTVLLIGSPLLILIALSIKLDSPGPILYVSPRVKKGFSIFQCYKFRTMHCDANEKLERILASCEKKRQEWHQYYKFKNDPRITRVGHFLRKTSLDELPQFFNVLIGDMSVVGPRPLAPLSNDAPLDEQLTDYLGQDAITILSVQPGITGLWQTSGRNHLTITERVKLDIEYIERRSLFLDVFLIAKTVPLMIYPNGAY